MVDPLGLALLFVALIHGESQTHIRQMTFKGTAIALGLLLMAADQPDIWVMLGVYLALIAVAAISLLAVQFIIDGINTI